MRQATATEAEDSTLFGCFTVARTAEMANSLIPAIGEAALPNLGVPHG